MDLAKLQAYYNRCTDYYSDGDVGRFAWVRTFTPRRCRTRLTRHRNFGSEYENGGPGERFVRLFRELASKKNVAGLIYGFLVAWIGVFSQVLVLAEMASMLVFFQ